MICNRQCFKELWKLNIASTFVKSNSFRLHEVQAQSGSQLSRKSLLLLPFDIDLYNMTKVKRAL